MVILKLEEERGVEFRREFYSFGENFSIETEFLLSFWKNGHPIVGLFSNSDVKDCVELSVNQVFLAEQLLSSYYGGQVLARMEGHFINMVHRGAKQNGETTNEIYCVRPSSATDVNSDVIHDSLLACGTTTGMRSEMID